MAHVFQTYKRDGTPHPRWRYCFRDWQNRRRTATGTESESETRRKAAAIESEHYEIRAGFRPSPNSAQRHARDPVEKVMGEYLEWGKSQGGKAGRPWSSVHAAMRTRHLHWWRAELALEALGDLAGILPRAEHTLRKLQATGKAGKTVSNTAESLRAFCRWCGDRHFLADNPLDGLAAFNTTPETVRRALSFEEAAKLMAAAPPHRALLYRVACVTGLRLNELRSLSQDDLDVANQGLHLRAEWTKNRKPGFQRLSPALVEALSDFIAQAAAARLYERLGRGKHRWATLPLLFVPTHGARSLDKDLAVAGISKQAFGGKLDFHALRVSFVSYVDQTGATARETQTAARHSTPSLTMNRYAKVRLDRMAEIAAEIDKRLVPENRKTAECQITAKAVGAENLSLATLYGAANVVRAEGFEPSTYDLKGRCSTS